MVAGNNDTILSEWFAGELTDEIVHWYVNSATTSIIGEMASELKMQYQSLDDVKALKEAIKENYKKEIDFLDGLPHIIDSNAATFVHDGIKPGKLDEQDYEYCLTAQVDGEQEKGKV